ncbi:hypothetical protein E4U41_002953 [Claviceps citrina]|nr:hypothetical protein E4U41_002953 [Claviceps citrina]
MRNGFDWGYTSQEASESWFTAIMVCLAPFGSCFKRESRHENEKRASMVVNSQPNLYPRPVFISDPESQVAGWKSRKGTKTSSRSSRTSSAGRTRSLSDGSSHRPLISAPSDFRHVHSGSFQLEPDTYSSREQPVSRSGPDDQHADGIGTRKNHDPPLELSIYVPDHRLSPNFPDFELPRTAALLPPPAHYTERSEQVQRLSRQLSSCSSQSFHVPRRQVGGRPSTARDDVPPPRVPARSRHRARAYAVPEVDAIRERVANALLEVEYLQRRIDDVIERQSLYVGSRPSTPRSMAHTMPELMPSVPALPSAALSFAERLNARLARPRSLHVTAPGSADYQGPVQEDKRARKPPPLPLVFRPALRKKKPFSAAPTGLFSGQELANKAGFASTTNKAKSVKGNDAFYEIVAGPPGRRSCESFDSISTWHTEDENQTAPASGGHQEAHS